MATSTTTPSTRPRTRTEEKESVISFVIFITHNVDNILIATERTAGATAIAS